MNQSGGVNQDDVLGTGDPADVEASVFGDREPPERPQEFGGAPAPKKRSTMKLALYALGGLALAGVLTFGAMLLLGGNSGADQYAYSPAPEYAPPPEPQQQPEPTLPAMQEMHTPSPVLPGDEAQAAVDPLGQPPVEPDATVATQPAPQSAVTPASEPQPVPAPPSPAAPAVPPQPVAAAPESPEAKIQRLEQRVEALSSDVERWRTQQLNAQRTQAASARAAARNPAPARSTRPSEPAAASATRVEGVTLRAVVDSNAWIQMSSGESVMVSPGEQIPGVGTVRSIDADSGAVKLNDGRVIR